MAISADRFDAQFAHFRDSLRRASTTGLEFRSFQEGLAAQWEDYKPRLRERALSLLDPMHWREDGIGRGDILNSVIASIEIEGGNDRNNLVRWVNRFGHANRSHYALLDARLDSDHRFAFEKLFFDFYLDHSDDAPVFERLCTLAGRRYDLLAYLFFYTDPTAPTRRMLPSSTDGEADVHMWAERFDGDAGDLFVLQAGCSVGGPASASTNSRSSATAIRLVISRTR